MRWGHNTQVGGAKERNSPGPVPPCTSCSTFCRRLAVSTGPLERHARVTPSSPPSTSTSPRCDPPHVLHHRRGGTPGRGGRGRDHYIRRHRQHGCPPVLHSDRLCARALRRGLRGDEPSRCQRRCLLLVSGKRARQNLGRRRCRRSTPVLQRPADRHLRAVRGYLRRLRECDRRDQSALVRLGLWGDARRRPSRRSARRPQCFSPGGLPDPRDSRRDDLHHRGPDAPGQAGS